MKSRSNRRWWSCHSVAHRAARKRSLPPETAAASSRDMFKVRTGPALAAGLFDFRPLSCILSTRFFSIARRGEFMKTRMLSALCIILCALTGCVNSQRTFLYTTGPGTSEVFAFEAHTNGSITPLGTPNFSAGSGPAALAIHPPGDFIYIADTAGSTVTLLQINKGNGELT